MNNFYFKSFNILLYKNNYPMFKAIIKYKEIIQDI